MDNPNPSQSSLDASIRKTEGSKGAASGQSYRTIAIFVSVASIVAILAIAVPLGVCFGGEGRCGRGNSQKASTASATVSKITEAASTAVPITFPTPTVAPLTEDVNPLLLQGFEWYIPKDGKHWTRLSAVLDQLHQIGVTNLWIPPPTKAATNGSIGYDVYDLWDLGEFDTHGRTATSMGSKNDLIQLVEAAHKWDIGIVADAALNQRSGADFVDSCAITRLDPNNREQAINPTRVSPVWVGFNFSSRGNRYSSKQWSCNDFSGIDYDQGTDAQGVFKIDGVNNDFATDVSTELGNFGQYALV